VLHFGNSRKKGSRNISATKKLHPLPYRKRKSSTLSSTLMAPPGRFTECRSPVDIIAEQQQSLITYPQDSGDGTRTKRPGIA
jgi:hypothetical protein